MSARLIPSEVSKRNVTVNRLTSTSCNPFGQKDEIGVNSGKQFKAFSSVKNTIQISPEGPAQVVRIKNWSPAVYSKFDSSHFKSVFSVFSYVCINEYMFVSAKYRGNKHLFISPGERIPGSILQNIV